MEFILTLPKGVDYELAYALKEAGFPQPKIAVKGYYLITKEHQPREEAVYAPILEELIEALGDDFAGVHKPYGTEITEVKFIARTPTYSQSPVKDDKKFGGFPLTQISTEGSTPTEAVAKLWLALNKQ